MRVLDEDKVKKMKVRKYERTYYICKIVITGIRTSARCITYDGFYEMKNQFNMIS